MAKELGHCFVTLITVAGGCAGEDRFATHASPLTYPAPGGTLTIGFEADAADQPIGRGTLLDEQYAAVGVHFNAAFSIGARIVDFPDFSVAPLTDNMICTWVAWQDTGRCFPPIGLAAAQLVLDLDFDACDVTIEGRTRGDGEQDGDTLTIVAYDGGGTFLTSDSQYVNTGPNPTSESVVHATVSATSVRAIRRVVIEDDMLDALDTLVVHRCGPPVAVCDDAVSCTLPGQCVGIANIDGGSYDPDGDPITLTQTPPNPYSLGTTDVTLSITDGTTTATCEAQVTINDCEAPSILCPPPVTLECVGNSCASFTPGDAVASDNCGIVAETEPGAQCFPLGTTPLPYSATDGAGLTASCSSSVTVVDTLPPVVTVGPAPNLAPPNHAYHTVTLADCGVSIVDACQGPLPPDPTNAAISCVTSDEPDDSTGDGQTINDIIIVDETTVRLRAERQGSGDGRVYTIAFLVTDDNGNTSEHTCGVHVRHGNQPAIDSGPVERECR